ncbi:MAG: hypothetical protein IKL02_08240 [Kiritimatiellae bacterium]|nr:hypothetical protein [Kiritimatiellia bacterium]
MKKKRFQLSKLGNLVKQITTKNVWLKILSLILAIATYIALYDNTVKNTEKNENADIISNFPFSINNNRRPADESIRREPKRNELSKSKKEAETLK